MLTPMHVFPFNVVVQTPHMLPGSPVAKRLLLTAIRSLAPSAPAPALSRLAVLLRAAAAAGASAGLSAVPGCAGHAELAAEADNILVCCVEPRAAELAAAQVCGGLVACDGCCCRI